jgi:hypothetical protein
LFERLVLNGIKIAFVSPQQVKKGIEIADYPDVRNTQ